MSKHPTDIQGEVQCISGGAIEMRKSSDGTGDLQMIESVFYDRMKGTYRMAMACEGLKNGLGIMALA